MFELPIPGYKKGDDLTIINALYTRPFKGSNGRWTKGAMQILFRDNVTGKKHVHVIENPTYTFFFMKEECLYTKDGDEIDYSQMFTHMDTVDPVTVPYKDLDHQIAVLIGQEERYYENIREGRRMANRVLHTHPRVFGSDINLEDYYRMLFNHTYQNSLFPLKKAYVDIELSYRGIDPKTIELGGRPINAITYITSDDKVFTLLLEEHDNPLIPKFKEMVKDKSYGNKIRDFIYDKIGGMKQYSKFKLDNLDFKFVFYSEENELNLLVDLFRVINRDQPDFISAWNGAEFDIPYITARIMALGGDPSTIMTHPDFRYRYVDCQMERPVEFTLPSKRDDNAIITSHSIFIDPMIQYASRRKNGSREISYRLDNIGSVVANVRKADYTHITADLSELPYKDYEFFVLYNIVDVVAMKCIEHETADLEYTFGKAIVNNSRIMKVHSQNNYIYNRFIYEIYLSGKYICGNNVNKILRPERIPFEGAFVADPVLLSTYSKMVINGIPVTVYNNSVDFDFTALYPSEVRNSNLSPHTLISEIILDEKIHDKENLAPGDKPYRRSGQYIEDFTSDCFMEFAERYFKLAGVVDLVKDVHEYGNMKSVHGQMV